MGLVKCLIALFVGQLVAGSLSEWDWLKGEFNGSEGGVIAAIVAEKWSTRPADFFRGISEESWERLIPLLSAEDMAEIQGKEFEKNLAACKAPSPTFSEGITTQIVPPLCLQALGRK